MRNPRQPKHRILIHDIGRVEDEGALVEVHSRGGSLLNLKRLIETFSKDHALDIRTIYNTKLGASYLGVIFAPHNAASASDRLDDFLIKRHEFRISGYFSDAVAAASTSPQERDRQE